MTLIDVPHIFIPDPKMFATKAAVGFTSVRKHFPTFMVPKTGSITHVGFRLEALTTSQTIRVGLETVSTTTGFHTGTQYGGSAVGTQASPAANTFYEVALATPASAVQGDVICAAFQWDSATGDTWFYAMESLCAGTNWTFPYHDEESSGTGNKLRRWPNVSIKYSDGTYAYINGFPGASQADVSFNSGSTPDERASRFKLPFPARVIGACFRNTVPTNADFSVILYEGTTALATQAIDANQWQGTGDDYAQIFFDAAVTLTKGTVYRIAIRPDTANNNKTREISVSTAAMMAGMPGGAEWYLSTRTNAGAWTDTTTTFPNIGIILDRIDDGASPGQKATVITGSRNY